MPLLDTPGAEYLPRTSRRLPDHRRRLRHLRSASSVSATLSTSSTTNLAPACASSRFILTATTTSSTRSLCFTPRPRATHCRNFSPASTNIVLTILQPVSIEPDAEMVSSVAVTPAELDAFVIAYRAACDGSALGSAALGAGPLVSLLPGETDLPGAHQAVARSRPVHGAGARHVAPEGGVLTAPRSTAWISSTRSRTSARRCMIRPSARSRTAIKYPVSHFRPVVLSVTGAMKAAAIDALD